MGIKVLSLFDGMACGMIAFKEAGIKVDSYSAYEVDKYAIKTATHNFPEIEEKGDVFNADFTEYKDIDFLIGGSPCTYWSIAQKNNRETEASGLGWELFSQYVRALNEAKPKYFIYENNKSMSKAIRDSIRETFGFEEVCINSALVSAQNRQRYYWVGKRNENGTYSKINVEQPGDRGILLKHILETGYVDREKAHVLKHQAGNARDYFKKHHTQIAFEPVGITKEGKAYCLTANYKKGSCPEHTLLKSVRSMVAEPLNTTLDGKSQILKAQYYKNSFANFLNDNSKGMQYSATGVAEPVRSDGDKSKTLTASYYKYAASDSFKKANPRMGIAELVRIPEYGSEEKSRPLGAFYSNNCGGFERRMFSNNPSKQQVDMIAENVSELVPFVTNKLEKAVQKFGYIPEMWNPYNNAEITDKSPTLTANCASQTNSSTVMVTEPLTSKEKTKKHYSQISFDDCIDITSSNQHYQCFAVACEWDEDGIPIYAVSGTDEKKYPVYKVEDSQITIKDKKYPIKLKNGYYIIRKLTVKECMRLQTVPDWYEFPVSNTQAYKMLGNGWTVQVIVHLIKSCLG